MKEKLEIVITNAVTDYFDAAELNRQRECLTHPVTDAEGYVSLSDLFGAKQWRLFFTMIDALTVICSLVEMGSLEANPASRAVSDDWKKFRLARDSDEHLIAAVPITTVLQ